MTRAKTVKLLLVFAFLLSLISCFVTYQGFKVKYQAQYWVDHTYAVIDESVALRASYKDAEISQRDFIITRDTSYLSRYNVSIADAKASLKKLRVLTSDNALQSDLIDHQLMPVFDNRISQINQLIYLFKVNGQNSSNVLATVNNPSALENIQRLLSALISKEKELLDERHGKLSYATLFTEGWMYSSMTMIAVTSILAFLTIQRVQKQNDRLFNSLQENNESLETRIADQTEEIRKSNKDLHKRNLELAAINEELQASQEEIKSNLDYISALKIDIETKERLYRLLAENSQDMITIVGLDSRIEYVSPACKEIVLYEPEQLIGTKGFDLIANEDAERVQKEMLAVKDIQGRVSGLQFRMKRKDGTQVWVESQTTPIFDEQGMVIKRQTSVREITERKKAEAEILAAKEKAEEATLAKSQFLSTMSHEIRTPMNAVIGLTNILLINNPREDQAESLKLLKFSGENLLTIINDILDFNKIEAGKITLEEIHYDLHELLTNTKNVLEKRAHEKGISLHFNLNRKVPHTVIGDPVRMSQILTNLISNAIKFTEKGYVELSVSSSNTGKAKHKIRFQVKDSGIGIDASKLEYIFERFSQASSDTTRKFGGTGLGLSITKHLVEMMGGRMAVQSTLGYGSTFEFEIEMMEGSKNTLSVADKNLSSLKDPVNKGKILVAEDNRVNQIVVNNFLKNWGIQADFANNGLEALELIQNKSYQLVLMDLQMPEMDGYTAALRIRETEGAYFKNVPIIALTASAMIEIKQKAFETGMNDYISKPFDPEELKNKIFHFLNVSLENDTSEKTWSENFNLFSEGNMDLKRELAEMLIKNINELQSVVSRLQDPAGLDLYKRILHKIATTLSFLGDSEFENVVRQIPQAIQTNEKNELARLLEQFHLLSEKLLDGLREELDSL
jgi:PAS domain S-box-containing protein